ncbi:uncharacterized protein LOC110018427 [Phalaenopsis equestris]|uniref:uncharacterized protein LOC110018427 n=1 Tax=Phalaenopsis equestris TaxID=78828 RepID=UPI0009E2D36C|nr:uncharacterized protein LOC110018427 [Phalaenopsis equestris]
MGSMEEYTTSRKQNNQQQSTIRSKLKLVLLLISSNLLTIYLFSSHKPLSFRLSDHVPVIHLWDSQSLLRELNSTQLRLSQTKSQLSQLHLRLHTSNSLLENLLSELGHTHNHHSITDGDLSGELKLAVGPHKLPLGFTSQLDTDELFPSLGSPCLRFLDELTQYMNYPIGGDCPVDDNFAQRLMLKGCEPLPRRRCHPKSPSGYIGPHPFPSSLWSIPPDTSIIWEPYSCKNYSCLVNRGKSKGSYDCKDCFDLHGRERTRWLYDNGGLDYSIDHVLSLRPPGTIRIGLDIGGGSGTFAARMRERNVTIVTSSMNFDGPFNSFIASRGLLALHLSVANRLPFFDHTLDIVHSMHVLSNWIPDQVLEFALYDIFRVLRPGGLFWLDHFFCVGREMNYTYVPMFERIGFQKLRWDAGRKLDRGIDKNEWYLSALLEKPMT